jgi:predicted N-acetyltransferase YhbS
LSFETSVAAHAARDGGSELEGPREVRPEEVEDLADMLSDVFAFGKIYTREQMILDLMRPKSRRGSKVLVEDGRLVSHIRTVYADVSVYGCTFKVASIGSVGTREECRGRGYAGAVLRHCLDEMAEVRAKVLIVSGDRSLYRRTHCAPAGRVFKATLGPSDLPQRRPDVTVRRLSADDWAPLAPLHQTESVRFARPMGFMSNLPFWWNYDRPEIWIIETDGRPAAYVMLAIPCGSDPREAKREVHEYAGSRAALLEALPAILDAGEIDEISMRALGHDLEMIYLLRQRGLEPVADPLGSTHRIIDLPGLMAKLRPYLRERLEGRDMRRLSFAQQGDRCTIAYGGQGVEISLSKAPPLVLGGPGAPPVSGGQGAPALSGDLGRVLSTIFPIPFPQPGFNYV